MPNRIIKESITTSATLAGMDDGTERHFWRLLVQADDFGYLDARAEVIRARAYPLMLGQVSQEESERRTLALANVGILHLFNIDDKRYAHFPTWDNHQQKRAKYSKYPQLQSCDGICNQLIANVPETYIRDNRNETLDKDNGQVLDQQKLFDEFWQEYPRKTGKAEAFKRWRALKVTPELSVIIMKGLRQQKSHQLDTAPEYIPHASTWLNGKRWEDELVARSTNGASGQGNRAAAGAGGERSVYEAEAQRVAARHESVQG